MRFFVGTYTGMGGPGVAAMRLEGDAIQLLSTTDALSDPSYVILSRDKARLYSIGGGEGAGSAGRAAAYRMDGDRLELLGTAPTGGAGPCHLCLSADERFLYVANYRSGSLAAIAVTPDGLGELVQQIQHEGSGPNAERQEGPHMHQVSFLPGQNVLCGVDLGIDAVMCYRQDPETGLLRFLSRLDVAGGLGPRHLAYAPDGVTAYLAHEMGNAVSTIRWTGERFETVETLPTLPADFQGESTCAAVRVSPDGRAVYVSNRGHDSLAAYDVLNSGMLKPAGHLMAPGKTPRDFALLSGGRALVAHQDSGTVCLVRMCGGMLRPIAEHPVKGAVCVCAE